MHHIGNIISVLGIAIMISSIYFPSFAVITSIIGIGVFIIGILLTGDVTPAGEEARL